VIVSHVTGVTRPILTFGHHLRQFALICDDLRGVTQPILTFGHQLRSFALICDNLRSLATICDHLRSFLPSADGSRSLQTPIWYYTALRQCYSSSKRLLHIKTVATHQYIKKRKAM
jgi:hypothetical protein